MNKNIVRKLNEEELLEFLDRFYCLWREWMAEKTTMANMLKLAGEAHQQIKERIQSYTEHQELTANYIDIVIDLYDQLEKKKPQVTEEWIEEKTTELYNLLYYKTFSRKQLKDFIRSLIRELLQGGKND